MVKYMRRRKNRKQVRVIVGLSICLLLLMTAGYAAFSTNLNITAKGNIKPINAAFQLKKNIVTSGEGLYKDEYINNRYIFKGSSPSNYIKFNNEIWRIISVESDDTLKIVKNTTLSSGISFDVRTSEKTGPRLNVNNTYCKLNSDGNYYGCNLWGSVNGTINNGNYSGTVSSDSSIKTYLNNDYYNTLTSGAKSQIDNHEYKVKFIYWNVSGKSIAEQLKLPFFSVGKANVGMINVDDYIKATANTECNLNLLINYLDGTYCTNGQCSQNCNKQNFLYSANTFWTMDPLYNYTSIAMSVSAYSVLANMHVYGNTFYVKPALYLKSDIKLTGSGTESDPYIIK